MRVPERGGIHKKDTHSLDNSPEEVEDETYDR